MVAELGGTPEGIVRRQMDEEDRLGSLAGLVRFTTGQSLDFLLIVDTAPMTPTLLKYRFHLADSQNRCLVRFDMSPHHAGLRTFPHHKHVGQDEDVVESGPPDLEMMLAEIQFHLAERE